MASSRTAWGIDIGNRALKAVKLGRTADGVRIEDYDFIEHETVLSQSGDNRDALIASALASFVQRKNPKGSSIAIGVPGTQSFARFVKLPPVEDKRIPEIVRFEAIQQIPFPLDDVEWTYQLFRPPTSPEVEVGIFAMRKELVNTWVKQFTSLDLNVQVVQMNPLAAYNAVQHDGRLGEGTAMIVDVGAENTDLIIASNDSIWLRSIPIGGNNFTETLVKGFRLPFAKAEDLKRNANTSKYARQIFHAMRPVFGDLVAEIQRSIGFYASVNRDNKISKVIALGGTFALPALRKYLQSNIQLDVEQPDAIAAGVPGDAKSAVEFSQHLLSLHGAYGLALQAMDQTKVVSSLLPATIRREKEWKGKTKWFALAASLFLVGGVAVPLARYVLESTQYAGNQGLRDFSDNIQRTSSEQSSKWDEVQGGGVRELKIVSNLESLTKGRDLWGGIYSSIAGVIPKPQPELAAALVSGSGDAIKQIPRESRRIFTIDRIASRYVSDIDQRLTQSNKPAGSELLGGASLAGSGNRTGLTSGAPLDPNAAATGAPKPGYIVAMRLITPLNLNTASVATTTDLFDALNAVAPTATTPNVHYAFRNPQLISTRPLGGNTEIMQRLLADYTARQLDKTPAGNDFNGLNGASNNRVPSAFQPGTSAATATDSLVYRDPVTGEDVRQDQVVEIVFLVELDPAPFVQPAVQPTASAQ